MSPCPPQALLEMVMPRTREEERLHKQRQRARRREEQAAEITQLHAVPPPADDEPGPDIPGPGEFERKVTAELDALGEVASVRMPGMAGNAIAMARILDNPAAIMQHAGAAGQLRAALLALHEAAKERGQAAGKVRMLRSRHVS